MKRILALALTAALMAGCQTAPGTTTDVHTGIKAAYSGSMQVYGGLLDSLWVQVGVGTRGGQTKYAISTRYLSTGVGWAFFREAWSFGQKLPFTVVREEVAGCAGGCSMIEEGAIVLTKAQFEAAEKNGIEFKLIGKNRSLVAKVPAKAFAEALAQNK